MKEKGIETGIIYYIRSIGGWVQKVHSGAVMKSYFRKKSASWKAYKIKLADKGTPDLVACIKGKFIAIEVKRDQDEMEKWENEIRKFEEGKSCDDRTIAQHFQKESISEAEGIYILACSVEEVEADLKQLGLI